jgi:hypothetical protein
MDVHVVKGTTYIDVYDIKKDIEMIEHKKK